MRAFAALSFVSATAAVLWSCRGPASAGDPKAPPIPGLTPADHLIQPGESRFAALYQLTFGGENAEAYWSADGRRLVLQRRDASAGVECDRIYVTPDPSAPLAGRIPTALEQVSDGRGVCTCSYFLAGDREILFASTTAAQAECPAPPDMAQGYVWNLHPEYDIYSKDLQSGALRRLTDSFGYDAEGTVSPDGRSLVFTSTRSGDPELWIQNLESGALQQVTRTPGYDGGAFFSHDGERLIFRATRFDPAKQAEQEAAFAALLEDNLVKPSAMELVVIDTDGSDRRRLTDLGGANWAPFFTPDDSQVLFASNHHVGPRSRNFDLFLVPAEGGPHGPDQLERVTSYDGFDSFPMFSPDGRWLAFSSNRGGAEGETNVFIARWRE
jgi:Tol biopolymer transport system component